MWRSVPLMTMKPALAGERIARPQHHRLEQRAPWRRDHVIAERRRGEEQRSLEAARRLGAAIVDRGITRLVIGRKAGNAFGTLSVGDAGVPALPGFQRLARRRRGTGRTTGRRFSSTAAKPRSDAPIHVPPLTESTG